MIVAGNRVYMQCNWCGKLVKMTGWFAGIHLCLTDEERAQQLSQRLAKTQKPPKTKEER